MKKVKSIKKLNTEHCIEYFINNKDEEIKAVGNRINGKKEGKWKFFFGDVVIGEKHYKNDEKNGKFISYIDEEIATVINYKNGLKDGKMQEYYKGLKIIEKKFVKGLRVSKKTISGEEVFKRFPDFDIDNI